MTPGGRDNDDLHSTLQAIRTSELGAIAAGEVKDRSDCCACCNWGSIRFRSTAHARSIDRDPAGPPATRPRCAAAPASAEAALLTKAQRHDRRSLVLSTGATFAGVSLSAATQRQLGAARSGQPAPALNRLLLEDAFPWSWPTQRSHRRRHADPLALHGARPHPGPPLSAASALCTSSA